MRMIRTKWTIAALIPLLFAAAPIHSITVQEIPSPRPAGWSVDLTGRISPGILQEINRLGDEVKAKAGAEIAVVVVGSLNGAASHDFAVKLFNTWRTGDPVRNNGVLVFAALDDHKAEVVLGSGIDNEQNRRTSNEIMQIEMVPRFRAGDPSAAVLSGAQAHARRILDIQLAEATPATSETSAVSETSTPSAAPQPFLPPAPVSAPQTASPVALSDTYFPLTVLFLGSFVSLAISVGGFRWVARKRPRVCSDCGTKMERLDEVADDKHLTASEQTEESVGSVDYDIWLCPGCGVSNKLRYGTWLTRYSRCPQCSARTRLSTKETIRFATHTCEGLVEILETCANCSYRSSSTYTTPVLVETSRSSSWSSSSSSFSSSPPSSSSSSGSGSGFSGGSSDGGGSSGQW